MRIQNAGDIDLALAEVGNSPRKADRRRNPSSACASGWAGKSFTTCKASDAALLKLSDIRSKLQMPGVPPIP